MLRLLRSRLSVRLTALFLLASLVPALLVGALTLAALERSTRADAEQRSALLAEVVTGLLTDAVRGAEEKLETVGRLMEGELAARAVGNFSLDNEGYRGTVVDRLEGLVEPAGAFLELQHFAVAETPGDEPQFVALAQQRIVKEQQPLESELFAQNTLNVNANMRSPIVQAPVQRGAPYRDRAFLVHEGFPTLRLSRPVHEPAGGTGALVAYVDFGAFAATLTRLVGDGLAIRVVDGAGTVLAEAGAAPPPSVEHVRLVPVEGDDAKATADTAWRVEVRESERNFTGPIADLRRQLLPWGIATAIAAVLASLVFSARVTRPIDELRRAAQAMERGDLAARTGVVREDEIGALAQAFDAMAEALHRLDAAKSEFLGNVSHELRTPLTSLRLTVGNVLDGVTGEVPEGQRAALERVRRELARLSTLVDDLLELARLEAGATEPALAPVALGELARECAAALELAAGERGVTLHVAGAGRARADVAMLRRVLWNLLDNAIKFGSEGGTVRIELEDGCLRVVDDGPGGVGAEAFERFRQGGVDGAKPGGAGLGLAIVARLVALQGGDVAVDDAPGGGARFTVRLRAAEADA